MLNSRSEQKWKDGDIGWIAVDYTPADKTADTTCQSTEAVGLGESTPSYKAACTNGVAEVDVYAYDCYFTGVENIDSRIPAACQPWVDIGKKVHFHFTLPCLCVDDISQLPLPTTKMPSQAPTSAPTRTPVADVQTAQPTDPPATASPTVSPTGSPTVSPTGSPTWAPVQLATNKLECGAEIFENFETRGQSESWTHGSEYYDDGFTTFLGRLGRTHNEVSKIFDIPTDADSVVLTFDFYDIDGQPEDDRILVGIQGSYLDLDLFNANGDMQYYNDVEVTRRLRDKRRISFNFDAIDNIYSITMTIPKHWYRFHNYQLPIAFKIDTTRDISEESYGVDNIRLQSNCRRRKLDSEPEDVTPPVSEPDESGDDGSSYCLSEDFPCEGGAGMVHVCHYSTRKGYETFCIPEADSEILRFYSHDYCGPCVGGFGGVNMQ